MQYRFAIIALVAGSLACGGGGYGGGGGNPTGPRTPGNATIQAEPSLVFSPSQVTVVTGDAVTWAFGSVGHDVFFDPQNGVAQAGAPADIPGVNANTSVSRTFTRTGTFRYTCHIHPGMQGTVTVTDVPPEGY